MERDYILHTRKQVAKKTVYNINAFNFFLYGSIGILISFFPLYFQSIGLSTVLIGLIMAGGPFISIFANPFWGYWSDRTQNIKRIILIMMVGNVVVVQFVFQFHTLSYIITAMLVFFFFQTPMFSQSNTLILNTIEQTNLKFGSFRIWGSLGWSVLAFSAGPIINKIGIDNLWILYSSILLIALLLAFSLPRGKVEGVQSIQKGGYSKELFANKYFLVFVVLGVLISVPNSINQTFSSLYIYELGGSAVLVGGSIFLSAIFEIPVFLLLDRYLSRKTRTMFAILIIVSILFAIRWFLMSFAVSPMQIAFIQMLNSVTFGGYYYIGTTLTAYLIPVNLRASGQAVFALTWGGVSGLVAGLVGGWMFEVIGASSMYAINGTITLFGTVGFTLLFLRMKRTNYRDGSELRA